MRPRLPALLAASLGLAAYAQAPQPPQPPVPSSPLIWEVREGSHPRLGPIRVAVPTSSVVTPVGKEKILSLIFFSCEKKGGRIAIELANAAESDQRSGLYPKQMPKIYCNPRSTAPRTEIPASWFVSEIGDAMARGFDPAQMRRCASIEVTQQIALPRGWGADSQRVDIELIPYKKELDDVLATCAEGPAVIAEAQKAAPPPAPREEPAKATPAPVPAAAPAPKPPVVAAGPAPVAAAPAPVPATAPAARPTATEAPWRSARTTSSGRTNVRSAPRIDASVVTMLDPGAVILVQPTANDWWRVRTHGSTPPIGYVREDRLLFP